MDLYSHLARVYDEIFPISPLAIAFIDKMAGLGVPKGRVIDLGSATGNHAFALAELGWDVVGVELSTELLSLSRNKLKMNDSSAKFIQADMRHIASLFEPASTDLVLCLGNTLPHLASLVEMRDFLANSRRVLRPGGRIILQLVNFDRAGAGFAFPAIEGGGFHFQRSYAGLPDGRIAFDTRITFDEGPSLADRTALFPVAPSQLETALREAGFSIERRIAGWDESISDPASSPYLIIVGMAGVPKGLNGVD